MNMNFEAMAVVEEEIQGDYHQEFVGSVASGVSAGSASGGGQGQRKESGKRGRRGGRKAAPEKQDMRAKLERSRQSARECRARKKLRYQYLEELVADREKAVLSLRKELEKYHMWTRELDEGRIPEGIQALIDEMLIKQESV